MDQTNIDRKVLMWLAERSRCMSAKAIAYAALQLETNDIYEGRIRPTNAGCLKECVELIDRIPEMRGGLDALSCQHPEWAEIARCWPELVSAVRFRSDVVVTELLRDVKSKAEY